LKKGSCGKIYETLKQFRKISPIPSFSKRGIPPFAQREARRDFSKGL
jgi:hypothetical protein